MFHVFITPLQMEVANRLHRSVDLWGSSTVKLVGAMLAGSVYRTRKRKNSMCNLTVYHLSVKVSIDPGTCTGNGLWLYQNTLDSFRGTMFGKKHNCCCLSIQLARFC